MLKYHIQTIEVGAGGAGSIIFNNIPQDYDDLYLVYSLRGTSTSAGNQAVIALNGSSANFTTRALYASSAGSGASYSATVGYAGVYSGSDNTANSFANANLTILNYRGSAAKSYSSDAVYGNNGSAYLIFNSGLWNSSSAITSISFTGTDTSSIWVQYSSASLYGIKRGSDGSMEPAAEGGQVTTSGAYTYHTFKSSSTFVPKSNLSVEVLAIAGGGGGGGNGGGGGAGGVTSGTFTVSQNTSYFVQVGAGAPAGPMGTAYINGSNTQILTLNAVGGGGGGSGQLNPGQYGGSGGGGAWSDSTGSTGGSGTPGQGFGGGGAIFGINIGGGGGGGAAAAGSNSVNRIGGKGGDGTNAFSAWATATSTGVSGYYAGGGGGVGRAPAAGGAGGLGGGGNGSASNDGTAGTANTGSGGASNGGSGIVIIRYLTPA